MVLRQNVESDARVYEGPGTIYQSDEGELLFKLYSGGASDIGMLARMFGPGSLKAGEIIPRTEYFTLEATSMKGADWRCDFVLPEFNQGVLGGPMATGYLYELSKTIKDQNMKGDSSQVSLRFGREFAFPGNARKTTKTFLNDIERGFSGDWTSSAMFRAAELEFELHRDEGSVFVSAGWNKPSLPRYLDLRICEALEFTFFQHERWVMRVVSEGKEYTTTLRPFPKPLKKSSFPPLKFGNSTPFDSAVWTLFGKYLEFVLQHDKPKWHTVSENIHLAVLGDSVSLESRLLGLSVAVEGVVNIGFPTIARADASLRNQIDLASKLISDSELDETFKSRIAGALGAMQFPRAKDKLRAFVDVGIIRRELVDAWSGMRNSAVHASGLDPAEIKAVHRDYQSALTLMHELVILLIGYTGAYTDYSLAGWPQREWTKTLGNLENSGTSPIGNTDRSSSDR